MLTPLLSPRAGTPEISADESSFEKVIKSLLAGNGPIAIDAERASGYRYSQRLTPITVTSSIVVSSAKSGADPTAASVANAIAARNGFLIGTSQNDIKEIMLIGST